MKQKTRFVKYPENGVEFLDRNGNPYVIFRLKSGEYQMLGYDYMKGWKCHSFGKSIQIVCENSKDIFEATDFIENTPEYEVEDLPGLKFQNSHGNKFTLLSCHNEHQLFMLMKGTDIYTQRYTASEIIEYLNDGVWTVVE